MTQVEQILCSTLRGVGPRITEKLEKLGISTIADLLFHLPIRYENQTQITPIQQLMTGQWAVIQGIIRKVNFIPGRRSILDCWITDNMGMLKIRLFHFTFSQRKQFSPLAHIRCYGQARLGREGWEMIHPDYTLEKSELAFSPLPTSLTSVYSITEGLTQSLLRKLVHQAFFLVSQGAELIDYLPDYVFVQSSFKEVLYRLHYPPVGYNELEKDRQRLAFEELLTHHLSLYDHQRTKQVVSALVLKWIPDLQERLLSQVGFQLTGAQKRVLSEIQVDFSSGHPMMRLLQGDVGSGKTIVAALAVLQVLGNGYQAAVMAPTELLAEQHYLNFQQWFEPLGFSVLYLTGSISGQEKQSVLEKLQKKKPICVVGTHALFQETVEFSELALIVVDEQHRFGVHQRLQLRQKGLQESPHQLVMTATPIPRTLAMVAYADLCCSVIDELPAGRLPIVTVALPNDRREEVLARVRACCQRGEQAYWVCTLVEESEILQCEAAEQTAALLQAQLPELKVGLVHGRLSWAEKEQAMKAFIVGHIHLLVATTVIEVGVDVPNANLMIIENPERLGLSQLHQLRGRVGRGQRQSHCVLLYQKPLSEKARERLAIIRNSQDGFEIAEKDLALRGAGELLGTRQAGFWNLKVADFVKDQALLRTVVTSLKTLHFTSAQIEGLKKRWLRETVSYHTV